MCLVSLAGLPPGADDAQASGGDISRGRLRRTAPLAALSARTASEAQKYSPTGNSANAFRYFTASPEYAAMGRIELSTESLIAELHATNYWGSMADEFFEGAAPLTALGKLDHAFFEDRQTAIDYA
jgi:hypothetical protein